MPEQQKVLVVDDDRDLLRAISIRLRAAGYGALTAEDGAQGLALALRERPAAIILDVQMPWVDGLLVLDGLRRRAETRKIPVIVLSAAVSEATRSKVLSLGARCFLAKPYQPDALLRAVRTETQPDPHAEVARGVAANEY
jgi:DNA-binding response OmpR family regulator